MRDPVAIDLLLTLAQSSGRVPIESLRVVTALCLAVVIFTIVFATLWMMGGRRRVRFESVPKKRRRGQPPGAWDESARRLRLPPDEGGLDDDDTRDIDPSDLSPGDVDLRPNDDDDDAPDSGRGGKGRKR